MAAIQHLDNDANLYDDTIQTILSHESSHTLSPNDTVPVVWVLPPVTVRWDRCLTCGEVQS